MSIKEMIAPFVDTTDVEEMRELAEAVRQSVIRGSSSIMHSTLLLDKDSFVEAFCRGVTEDAMSNFERKFPKSSHWFLRIMTGTLVTESFERDCGREFAEFIVPGTSDTTYTFFSQLEEHSADGELLMRIVGVRPNAFVIPAVEGVSEALTVWECTCEIQGRPADGDLGAFLEYMYDTHAFPLVQVIASDGKTVIAAYGAEGQWVDMLCDGLATPQRSQRYIEYLRESQNEMSSAEYNWQEKLCWAPGWDQLRFKRMLL